MNRSSQHVQRGVGLIEVLVAVLILSIGLLGLAGLQMRTLRDNQSALDRSVAVVETHFIADAMRADLNTARTGGFNLAIAAATPTASNFATTALYHWRTNLVAALGTGATGGVACNGRVCSITVQWNDSRASSGSTANTNQGAAEQTLVTEVYL